MARGIDDRITVLHQVTRFGFTRTEERVALELLRGKSNPEIAQSLGMTERTVKNHLTNLLKKAHVHNRVQLVLALLDVNIDADELGAS